jgi:heme-degrading monooxygenase HmoA
VASFHIVQVNVARPREPLGSELLREFVEALDPVNAVADESPGFVWRLQTEEGNATSLHVFDDDGLIVNMSVWESIEALRAFVYSTPAHLAVMKRRREWFERMDVYLALWWVPAGHVPTLAEAEERVTLLSAIGPSPQAFTFRRHFPPPGADPDAGTVDDDRWLCPA